MTSDDFVKIFYSYHYNPSVDWDNIDEIAWMYQEDLFGITAQVIASREEFIKRLDVVLSPKKGFVKTGESDGHLVLKSFATGLLN